MIRFLIIPLLAVSCGPLGDVLSRSYVCMTQNEQCDTEGLPKGQDGADGRDGSNGKDGVNGTNGTNGRDGNSNDDRVAELERRLNLNDQLDLMRDSLIAANHLAVNARIDLLEFNLTNLINQEKALRESADLAQRQALDQETQARIAGDNTLADSIAAEAVARASSDTQLANALAASIAAQTVVNSSIQAQIDAINSSFPSINSTLNSLQLQVNSSNTSISGLQSQINTLNTDVTGLKLRVTLTETAITGLNNSYTTLNGTVTGLSSSVSTLNGVVTGLSSTVNGLQTQLNQEGTKVYKCNASTSKERIFKINGKFYGVMNYVTTGNVIVVTGSSSQTYVIPKLCTSSSGGGVAQLPNSSGNCSSGSTVVPGSGQTLTIPAYSIGSVPVITDVQMAMEKLEDGSYITTDGAAACTFSVSGSTSTNLIQVQ